MVSYNLLLLVYDMVADYLDPVDFSMQVSLMFRDSVLKPESRLEGAPDSSTVRFQHSH